MIGDKSTYSMYFFNIIFFIANTITGDNMKVRLGYVAISKALEDVTTSKTITYTDYINKGYSKEKIYEVVNSNIDSLKKIMMYNVKNNIHFYILTSKLVPLATHEKVSFDYIDIFRNKYSEIGDIIDKNKIRVDLHPDQFAVLNSMNNTVIRSTIEILKYHYNILEALDIKDKVIILHVGSSACGKKASITRFINNFNNLPSNIRESIALENDDKTFNVKDVLYICERLNIPMVLDYHHFICNNEGENIQDYIERIINTWNGRVPKFHFSSPKSKQKKEFRSHSDYIDSNSFISFINKMSIFNKDIDIMLEAKAKDDALFRLVRELKYKTNYNFIDETTFIV